MKSFLISLKENKIKRYIFMAFFYGTIAIILSLIDPIFKLLLLSPVIYLTKAAICLTINRIWHQKK